MILYGLSGLFMLLYLIILITNNHAWGGWVLLLFFTSLAIAFRGSRFLKGLSFTMMILAVVSVAMYHPRIFQVDW